jgi:uncharacterized protein YbjT (DUF2867 family)
VAPGTELVRGDLLQPASLGAAFSGCGHAFYLVHSMNSGEEFEAEERTRLPISRTAARRAGVRRIVYLGGLGHGEELSPHMRSRAETGDILALERRAVIELQASIVIGSGSASFEMMRALVERLPVMITPRWVNTPAQPIAIEDVIEYLMAAARLPVNGNRTFEIGGADVTSYCRIHARVRPAAQVAALDSARPVPELVVIEPLADADHAGLCGDWAAVDRERPESKFRAESRGSGGFDIQPMGITRAIERALTNEDRDLAETRWSDARRDSGRGALRANARSVDQ